MLATPPTGLTTECICLHFISIDSVSKYKWRHQGDFKISFSDLRKGQKTDFSKKGYFSTKNGNMSRCGLKIKNRLGDAFYISI